MNLDMMKLYSFLIFLTLTLHQFTFLLIIVLCISLCYPVLPAPVFYVGLTPFSPGGEHVIQAQPVGK